MQPSQQSQGCFALQQLLDSYNNIQHSIYEILLNDRSIDQKVIKSQYQPLNRVILLFGNTSSGKTMVQYYLCRDDLTYGVEEKKQLPYIIPNRIYKNALIQKTPSKITTRVPNVRLNFNKEFQIIVFVEIPDIKQLKPQQQSVEYLFLERIFKSFIHIHLLLVIEEGSLDDGAQLIQDFECLTSFFNLQNQPLKQLITDSLSIIVNKVDKNTDQSDTKQKLSEVNNDVISQQNEHIHSMIQKILQKDRIYVIKSVQPFYKEQDEFLNHLFENSVFSDFSHFNIQPDILQQITSDEQSLTKIMKTQQLNVLWSQSVKRLYQLISYLSDQKNRQNNFSQMVPLIRKTCHQNRKQLSEQENKQQKLKSQFEGALDDELKQHLYNLITQINNLQQYSAFNYSFNEVYNSLYKLKQMILKVRSPKYSKTESAIYFKAFVQNLNQLLIMILYITQVLNYTPESKNEDAQVLSKEILIAPTQQMLKQLKDRFHQFNLQLLAVQKKKGKNQKKTNIKQKQPTVTIVQLRQQFLKLSKTKKSPSILNAIFNLPNTHFKLYMLIQQFKPNHEFRKQSEFQKTIAIVKQISRIISINNLFVDSIKFLLLVPDWNKIEQLIGMILKSEDQQKNQTEYQNDQDKKEKFNFLNRLGMYATKKRRNKLANTIYKLVDSFINIQKQLDPQFDHQQYIQERNQASDLPDTWYISYVHALYIDQLQSTKLYPAIVEKVKINEQKDQERIDKINQFHYLMSQELIQAKKQTTQINKVN